MSALALAWLNLLHHRVRTLISVAGVAFAVILIFMQMGFLGSVERTAVQLFDHLDFDLLMTSKEYLDLNRPDSFSRHRLAQAYGVEGVTAVRPMSIGYGLWRDPRSRYVPGMEPRRWNILILGVQPADLPLIFNDADRDVFQNKEDLMAARTAIARQDAILIDRRSRPEFGSRKDLQPGSVFELNERQVQLFGKFEVGTGFGYNGVLLTSEETLIRLGRQLPDRVTFGLVKLAPGTDRRRIQAELQQKLSGVRAYARNEINQQETDFWVQSTAVGRFFTLGVVVAVVVGMIFVYQMIAADIRNHLSEYATFKAIGYRGSYLARIVLWQANLLALIGFLPGLIASLGFYEITRQAARIPIGMTATRVVTVLVLTIGMCLFSGLFAMRKVHSADPADLF